MLMSHTLRFQKVYVEYKVRVVTGRHARGMEPVRPFWIRADGCANTHPSYTVPGGGGPGSSYVRSWRWRVPFDGRIVAAGGHLHGGARNLQLTEPGCDNREVLHTKPLYAPQESMVYGMRPVLHEPGPWSTSYFLSRDGIPVRKGQALDVVGTYDNEHPRARVMSVLHVYVARGKPKGAQPCAPLPADARQFFLRERGTSEPPYMQVPLNTVTKGNRIVEIASPVGPVTPFDGDGVINLQRGSVKPSRIEVPAGSSVEWRFLDRDEHAMVFANGPAVAGTPTMARGETHVSRFYTPGTYQLFCYLHPLTMHEEIVVTPR
jgi:Cupredoxin-like domain